ncbi:hypothetical protein FRC11_010897, partial [Ceratobasidium sp. 423]
AMQPLEGVITALHVHGCNNVTALLESSAPATIPVAQGGFGDVFRGQLRSGTSIAIKTLRVRESDGSKGGDQKRAARELYTWSKCKHLNVVELIGLAVFNDTIAMVSDWEENGNLSRYLSRNPSADQCLLVNVLVAQDGTPKLMDFGTAHLVGGDLQFQENEPDPGQTTGSTLHQEQSHAASAISSHAYDHGSGTVDYASLIAPTLSFTLTKTGLKFSPRWAAPELFSEEVNGTTTASDVYALGMTILETFTSTVPFFEKKSDHAVIMEVVIHKKTPTRPQKGIPEGSVYGDKLWDILTKCWSHDPKGRPSAGDVWNQMKLITLETPKESEIKPEESEIELEEEGRSEQEIA